MESEGSCLQIETKGAEEMNARGMAAIQPTKKNISIFFPATKINPEQRNNSDQTLGNL